MLRLIVVRAALFAAPFVFYFAWRETARRGGGTMESTPWAWLVAAGAGLAALSLLGSALLGPTPTAGTYVTARVRPDGGVDPGGYVTRAGRAPVSRSDQANR